MVTTVTSTESTVLRSVKVTLGIPIIKVRGQHAEPQRIHDIAPNGSEVGVGEQQSRDLLEAKPHAAL